jgi:hypothetical protein
VEPVKLPDARDIGDELASLKSEWKKSGGGLELAETWKLRDRWIPVKDYDKIKKTVDGLKNADALSVVLSRKGGSK